MLPLWLQKHQVTIWANLKITAYHLSLYQQSFFPANIKLWNELNLSIRSATSLDRFKTRLKNKYLCYKPSSFYFSGINRYYNVLHARLRNECSALKYDLFRSNLIDGDVCSCGYSQENAEHFLITCNHYRIPRESYLRTYYIWTFLAHFITYCLVT